MVNEINNKLAFNNAVINKKKLQDLMYVTFHNYGVIRSSLIADKVKNLTFHYATISGISLSVEDLRVPSRKRTLIGLTTNEVDTTEQNYGSGSITVVERFQKVIDIWNNASNFLKEEVVTYFRESDPLNPLYIMAFSGARGNISQVRQLVGMRGLMADPQGQIIDLPIKSNFREGLTVTEYIISSYGARKGLVDTALRTADSGYLTRRLVDVAQDIIVRDEDCQTQDGLHKNELINEATPNLSLKDRVIGRLLAVPIKTKNNQIIPANTNVTAQLIDGLDETDLEQLKVRSPLTCTSIRSVCRNCYGWHLAYSKIVDLGEAIGIIAAQSIGEPGTQLTMRTFHTGGVFSGDLTRQIRAPFQGLLSYKILENANLTRTLHGERSFLVGKNIILFVENNKGTRSKIKLANGATLLSNTNQKVYTDQIVAEIKKETNLILEEDSKTVYTNVAGEVFFQDIDVEEKLDKQGSLIRKNLNTGLIWVLHGERYSLPRSSELVGKLGQKITNGSIIARKKIRNTYPGIVKLDRSTKKEEIRILNFSLVLQNATIFPTVENNTSNFNVLQLGNKQQFDLEVQPNETLYNGQTIAVLKDSSYTTETGGIVTYNLDQKFKTKKRKGVSKMFSGSLYWIPEETHYIKNEISFETQKAYNGIFISKGTELLSTKFSKLSGLLQFNLTTQELTIKPGELFKIESAQFSSIEKTNGFVKPGEIIVDNIIAQKLSYVEFISINNVEYVLIRPVQRYRVPREKGFVLNHNFFPAVDKQNLKIKTVKKIFHKNWECIKSDEPVELLKTSLVIDLNRIRPQCQAKFEVLNKGKNNYKLQISLYEVLTIDDIAVNYQIHNLKTAVKSLTSNNQYVNRNTDLAQLEIFLPTSGILASTNSNIASAKEILILQDKDIRPIYYNSKLDKLNVKVGDLIRAGSWLGEGIKSGYSGQVYKISENIVYIRLGRPYLISEGAVLEVECGSLVQRLDKLATLIYEKLKTVDIVQGLPKVEEILEARKIKNPAILAPHEGYVNLRNSQITITSDKGPVTTFTIEARTKVRFSNGDYVKLVEPLTDGPISPHLKLETLFQYYHFLEKLPNNIACRYSFRELQLFLVNEVQRTYLSQGVQIADKHVEIIVKQMTSKVRIDDSGDTTLLPGELLNLYQVETITKATLAVDEQTPFYTPLLLGITKASLNSDSFISAASFQETTRVLTEAAIEGKKDWLHGLKENVIIGRLIPAGTGFKYYQQLDNEKVKRNQLDTIIQSQIGGIKDTVLQSRFNRVGE